jgi:3-oxoacyl-[acyl-carrier-protein] synthase III
MPVGKFTRFPTSPACKAGSTAEFFPCGCGQPDVQWQLANRSNTLMAHISLNGVEIRGITTSVPARFIDNTTDEASFCDEEVRRVVELTGVKRRHVAPDYICASDLCVAAAENLLAELGWERTSIDLLVYVTQSADYVAPCTSCSLQDRLGLTDQCAAFDVILGCSAYPYGLSIVTKLLQGGSMSRALLLVGDTPSKLCDPADRATSLIFGDAGSATALETVPSGGSTSSFVLHSDGSGLKDFIVRAGGFRDRFNPDRREHYIDMNGPNIFVFTLKRVPPMFKEALGLAQIREEEIDYFIFHQANGFILDHLRKKLKLPVEKVPVILDRFGNTGGVSLPLTITQGRLHRPPDRNLQLLLLGFGVGLSWASACLQLNPQTILNHLEC